MRALTPTGIVTVREAARRLNVTTRTVYRMVERGLIEAKPVKPQRGIGITEESIDSYLAALVP